MEHTDLLVNWSRAQFALTALYHWLFVPLTLGLSFIIAIMETIYVKTGDEKWKEITKFWMKLFGINFAIGLATGIIMEFEFGTNWSNYSWIVGDIFGAPLAIEGIMAFFLESTFFAVMFFGWNKVSKKAHLLSTWLVAIGSNLSALWILVANGWMQHPVGMHFNPDTARNEMENFWAVLLNPNAVSKFLHTVSSGYILSAIFVVGISAWYLLKKRDIDFAKKSMLVASSFGLVASIYTVVLGDESAHQVTLHQPMKLAAMEGLYDGEKRAGIIAVGMLNPEKEIGDKKDPFIFKIEIPDTLSILGYHRLNSFVPGIDDLIQGKKEYGIMPIAEKIKRGKVAIAALHDYKMYKKEKDMMNASKALEIFKKNQPYMGYGYLEKDTDAVPNVPITFYSFHTMVTLGFWFVLLMILVYYYTIKNKIEDKKCLLRLSIISIPLAYIAAELGWVVAEVGRQPWTIQDLLPVNVAVSNISSTNVMITFWLFAIVFTGLLIAEVGIMLKAIKIGPKGE